MSFTCYQINDLTQRQLLEIMAQRVAVFVVEQNCPYQEIDQADKGALHLCQWSESGELMAYARLLDKGETVSFGRVLVTENYRSQKLGRKLIEKTIAELHERFPNKDIIISGQTYLLDFYKSFGFVEISEEYLEDDIPHIDLKLS
ncbi:GNAT family N-acetyltransferase [Vagococcus coleopterorum]|uniref:GNAT family N-acetyltransferase n=1 Tax=Vagococcus coleopterorum TaxID=2714946 RepID=A0A6G8AM73_9ENTE|nr:GNAT family N-acetyltransferase [Vagococcus coleopterorum]QIL46184.1 GNAT family N-acetyltransferase [Vagococcus coleopterorum]